MKLKAQKPSVYAFIDSQNLNLGVRSQGWRIDYKKFRLYLKNKYRVEQAFIFIGMVDDNQELYETLRAAGFKLIFKPTVQYFENGKATVKGNVDAELVLYAAAIEYPNYDKAIIVTGDGDFYCLVEYLEKKNKLLYLMAPTRRFSKLLRRFSKKIVHIQEIGRNFMYQKSRDRRSVETLGLPGHGDTFNVTNQEQRVKSVARQKKSPRKDNNLKGTSSVGDTNKILSKGRSPVKVSNKKTRSSGRITSLGQPGHGDKNSIAKRGKRVNKASR